VNFFSWLSVGLAVAFAGAAIYAGSNLPVAVPTATVAVLLVSIVGATELHARSSRFVPVRAGVSRQPTSSRVESDSLLRLRQSFTSGEMGRSSVLASLRALERDLSPTGRTALTLDGERAVLNLPPDQFRKWVDDHLQRIEAAT
jgi:hypothetical protein